MQINMKCHNTFWLTLYNIIKVIIINIFKFRIYNYKLCGKRNFEIISPQILTYCNFKLFWEQIGLLLFTYIGCNRTSSGITIFNSEFSLSNGPNPIISLFFNRISDDLIWYLFPLTHTPKVSSCIQIKWVDKKQNCTTNKIIPLNLLLGFMTSRNENVKMNVWGD